MAELPLELPPLKAAGSTAPFVAADLGFARLAGDSGAAIAFERWAAPDAHMFAGGGMLVQGPRAIARVMSAPATWTWHPVAAGASVDGSMGWTVGEAVITAADGHSGPVEVSHGVEAAAGRVDPVLHRRWERAADGPLAHASTSLRVPRQAVSISDSATVRTSSSTRSS